MDDYVSIDGPIEVIDDRMFVRIPLEPYGKSLVSCTKSISFIADDHLCIEIHEWMLEKLEMSATDLLHINNDNGEFNMRKADERSS